MALNIIYHPLFRGVVLWLAIVVLIVFCIDKSRQNRRTRWALYNCIYPLYGSAVFKAVQLMDLVMPFNTARSWVCLAITVVGALIYARFFKQQSDIPYNRLFWLVGWIVVLVSLVLQAAVLVYSITRSTPIPS